MLTKKMRLGLAQKHARLGDSFAELPELGRSEGLNPFAVDPAHERNRRQRIIMCHAAIPGPRKRTTYPS